MKILLVSQFYYPERFSVTDIAESFVKAGHEVTVITGKPNYGYGEVVKGYEKVKYEEINGVKVHRVKLFPRKDSRISVIKNYLSFHNNGKRFVRHFNGDFDIVLAFSLSPVISVSPALHFAKKQSSFPDEGSIRSGTRIQGNPPCFAARIPFRESSKTTLFVTSGQFIFFAAIRKISGSGFPICAMSPSMMFSSEK